MADGASAYASIPASSDTTAVEIGSELRQMIDTRELRIKKKRTRISLALTCTFLAAIASAASWVAFSTKGNQSWTALTAALRESKGDFKNLTGILGAYDKQLEKIAVQSARVDAATRALGVDPTAEANQGAGELNDEMKKMQATGSSEQGAPTSLDRNQSLQQKFGVVSKLAGRDPEKAKAAAESDVKF
ncbi:MAG: hypothetical protein JWO82_1899 [Akkermansiaceae bacterium]|nr:hypothetical protein [Akkermansiaceae bacterium]